LSLDKEVRLKNGYIIKGESVVKDANGEITEIHATYDPLSKSGTDTPEALRKVKGTIHWVSRDHALDAEVRLYDRLFSSAAPDADKEGDFMDHLNPNSLEVITAKVEPSLKTLEIGQPVQFQRTGYFVLDPDSKTDTLVFNRTVSLRDSWGKLDQD
jgi:glutaminyl-tRNA synthetase